MTQTIKNPFILGSALVVLAFGMFAFIPATASANYSYGGYHSYPVRYPVPQVIPTPVYNPPQVIYNPAPIVYNYPTPVYNYNTYVAPPVQQLQVQCYPMPLTASAGTPVTWYASAYGGNGYFNYSWTGNDGLYGYGQSVAFTYYTPGYKNATVTVISGGQSISVNCSGSVNVYGAYYAAPAPTYYQTPTVYQQYPTPYPQPIPLATNAGLDVGCYADPSSATINQPITWTVEVTGGAAPYSYSWTGTDGLSGNQSSVTTFYNIPGQKNAIVSVTSADGLTATHACSVSATIHGASSGYVAPHHPAPAPQAPAQSNGLSASALFSLANIPWGWVAVLIILVLFATVMYLVFNRAKI